MDLMEQLDHYQAWNEQEERDRELILGALKTRPLIFTREDRMAHMTNEI